MTPGKEVVEVPLEPPKAKNRIQLGEGVELDPASDELCYAGRVSKLERIPAAVLLLLVERRGQVVRREDIVERVWGKDVFLDTDNSINSAIRKIRQALKDDPDSPRFIQTISGRGYRFLGQAEPTPVIARVESPITGSPPPEAPTPSASDTATRSVGTRLIGHRAPVVVLAGVLIVLIATVWLLIRKAVKSGTEAPIRSVAVLPLQNLSGDTSQEYLADGMTESIISRLSAIRELRVISRTSVMRFKETKLSVPEIARQLNVDAIVEGSVIRDGNHIRVHAQLIRAATDAHFWSEEYDRELKDVLSLQSEVAQSIAQKVQVTITAPEHERLATVTTVPTEVYENYLKGRYAGGRSSNEADIEKSIKFFQLAIDKDPSFAPAYLGLSEAYTELGSIFIGKRPEEMRPKAMDALRKALDLDPQSVEAHLDMANLVMVQWHWAEAESEFRRALELNPNSAAAHLGMSHWLMTQGRTDEAIAWVRRARELDPLEVGTWDLYWPLFISHRYPEAIRELRSALAIDPNDTSALWGVGYALTANGQPEEAIPLMEKGLSLSDRSPGIMGVLIRAYAHAGRRADALSLLAELKRRQTSGYIPTAAFVNGYLGVGETNEAFAALEKACEEHSQIVLWLKVHPHFDPIRNDPRFRVLLHRVGLD